jgi:DNA ligase (NAD+)
MDQNIKSKLDSMDIEFDGLVIKIKDNNLRELLGSTNHHPRRAIAYKYPAKQATSVIEKVEWQVGRSGILTPVAHVKPIQLSGVTIARVTLHNPDFIREKDIRIGDHVFIQRS